MIEFGGADALNERFFRGVTGSGEPETEPRCLIRTVNPQDDRPPRRINSEIYKAETHRIRITWKIGCNA